MDTKQISLELECGLVERYPDIMDLIGEETRHCGMLQKQVAAEMDLSPSDLSRKLRSYEGDPRAFSVHDLDRWLTVTKQVKVVMWFVEKYLMNADDREDLISALTQYSGDLGKLQTFLNKINPAGAPVRAPPIRRGGRR